MNYQDRILKRVDVFVAQNPGLKSLHDLFSEYLTTNNIGSMDFGARLIDTLKSAGFSSGALYDEAWASAKEADLYGNVVVRSPQEFALIQSGSGEKGIDPTDEPYRIMALNEGASLEDVRLARNKIKPKAHGCYFGLDADHVRISVEDVDSEGRTMRDPVPLREDGTHMESSEFRYAENFPFRRK